jgi:hypothetical protein
MYQIAWVICTALTSAAAVVVGWVVAAVGWAVAVVMVAEVVASRVVGWVVG